MEEALDLSFDRLLMMMMMKKILPMEADLFRKDRRTDIKKLTVTFRSFANASNKQRRRLADLQRHCVVRKVFFAVCLDVRPKNGTAFSADLTCALCSC